MSEPYQLFMLMAEPLESHTVVHLVHEVLLGLGATIDNDCLYVVFSDGSDEDETDPEPASDVAAALERVASSPCLGLLEYHYADSIIMVSFLNEKPGSSVDCVRIGIWQRAFERGGEDLANAVRLLALKMHAATKSIRTLMDWGLESRGFDWREELHRVRRGEISGSYSIVDIT